MEVKPTAIQTWPRGPSELAATYRKVLYANVSTVLATAVDDNLIHSLLLMVGGAAPDIPVRLSAMSAFGEGGRSPMRAVGGDHRQRSPGRAAAVTSRARVFGRVSGQPVSARALGVLAVVGLVIAFSLSSTLVKRAETPGVLVAFWKMTVVSVVWNLYLRSTGRRVTWRHVRQAFVPGVFSG
jgi:hypothetical protein